MKTDEDPKSKNNIHVKCLYFVFYVLDNYQICDDLINFYNLWFT